MISVIGVQNRHTPQTTENEKVGRAADGAEGTSAGKSADSVGHRAKVMVAELDDTAPGAQGRAASMIARMDLTVLTPEIPADEPQPVITGPGLEAVETEHLDDGSPKK
ncbi:hypothetical protein ACG873_01750 (plasmid) [Mesorhizobium sp. AaZ16]|uniref:hypothetical protein n=1 Tax=Mesorhizobium sp. AaZ16 TaxID=3402289 RepID=UPI00374FC405